MADVNEDNKQTSLQRRTCPGCGALFQQDTPDGPGYLPSSAIAAGDPLCQRCYRIRHYGEFSRIAVPSVVYRAQISHISSEPGLVLYVLDVFDLAGSIVRGLADALGRSVVWAVVNKVDLLPRDVRPDTLSTWVRTSLASSGIQVERVLFVSGQTGTGVPELATAMAQSGRDPIYAVGMSNVGKSTLLNRLVHTLGAQDDAAGTVDPVDGQDQRDPFTASRIPGTTLGLAWRQANTAGGESRTIVDTPGLLEFDRMTDHLCGDCLKVAVPQARLRPRVYQLDAGQSLWLGGFARFDFESGEHQPVVCYVSNALTVHRTRLENADHIGREHADDILKAPCPECRAELGTLRRHPVSVGAGSATDSPQRSAGDCTCGRRGCDIVLPGLGWISLFGTSLTGAIWLPKGIRPVVRPRWIGTSVPSRQSPPSRGQKRS